MYSFMWTVAVTQFRDWMVHDICPRDVDETLKRGKKMLRVCPSLKAPSYCGCMQGVQEPLFGLSTYASESPEWTGILPLGLSSDNYTISIAGSLRFPKGEPVQGVAMMVVPKPVTRQR